MTGYRLGRAVLGDPRFSTRPELQHPPIAARMDLEKEERSPSVLPGFFLHMDPPEHMRYGDRDRFRDDAALLFDLERESVEVSAALGRMMEFLGELGREAFGRESDDLLSELARSGELSVEELTGIAFLVLTAGHETTAGTLGFAAYALCDPEQAAVLRDEDETAAGGGAEEELLRYMSATGLGLIRTAVDDVELDGQIVAAGETVTVDTRVANRDPEQYPDAEEMDLTRATGGHLTFGHGTHQRLGQQLARLELRAALTRLVRHFPPAAAGGAGASAVGARGRGVPRIDDLAVIW